MKYTIFIILSIFFFFFACDLNETAFDNTHSPSLMLQAEYELEVPEPSGLTCDLQTNTFWTVSDETGRIYQIDSQGNLEQILPFTGTDLEGITYDADDNCLWVVEETDRNLVKVSLEGIELERYTHLLPGNNNSGLEGICIDEAGNFFLLKEKNPGQFIELSQTFGIENIIHLDFAGDYSGIAYDAARAGFWIVSDQNETVYLWDKINGVREQYSLPITKPEGIFYLAETDLLYIVSDAEEKMYVMRIE